MTSSVAAGGNGSTVAAGGNGTGSMAASTSSGGNGTGTPSSSMAGSSSHSGNHSGSSTTHTHKNGTVSTSVAAAATKKVSGNMKYQVQTMAACESLKNSASFKTTLCSEVGKMMSVTVTTKTCSIATTCSTR